MVRKYQIIPTDEYGMLASDGAWYDRGGTLRGGYEKFKEFMQVMEGEKDPTESAMAFLKPLGAWLNDVFTGLIQILNIHSADIITTGIMAGGLGMMVSPLWGDKGGKWLGRIFAVTIAGTVWRLVI